MFVKNKRVGERLTTELTYMACVYTENFTQFDLEIRVLMLSYPQNRLAFTFLNKGRYGLAETKGFLDISHLVLKDILGGGEVVCAPPISRHTLLPLSFLPHRHFVYFQSPSVQAKE